MTQQQLLWARTRAGEPVQLRATEFGALLVSGEIVTAEARVPGLHFGSAYDAKDALGTKFSLDVPPQGFLHMVRIIDTDSEEIDFDVHIFDRDFTGGSDADAFTLVEAENQFHVAPVTMTDFVLTGNSSVAAKTLQGIPYTAPNRKLYCQLVTSGAPTYGAGTGIWIRATILA